MMTVLAALMLTAGRIPPAVQDRRTIMLAAVMVRHQEPVAKGGIRATIAEIYPIAWQTRGQWLEASVDSSESVNPSLRSGDRFEIYQNGASVGWFDVNRVTAKPYPGTNKVVGLGGWSLPRKLYPYRLDRKTNLNYLYRSIYDWGNNKYKNSVQPFLALSVQRRSPSSTQFSPAQIKRNLQPVVLQTLKRISTQVDPNLSLMDFRLRSFKAYDLDDNRIPEVVAVYDLPRARSGQRRTFTLVGEITASYFEEHYRATDESLAWDPFDVLDVDGDGYKEIVMLGRGDGRVSFRVLQGDEGKLRKVFEGASFG
jgi:hypothetical protein